MISISHKHKDQLSTQSLCTYNRRVSRICIHSTQRDSPNSNSSKRRIKEVWEQQSNPFRRSLGSVILWTTVMSPRALSSPLEMFILDIVFCRYWGLLLLLDVTTSPPPPKAPRRDNSSPGRRGCRQFVAKYTPTVPPLSRRFYLALRSYPGGVEWPRHEDTISTC